MNLPKYLTDSKDYLQIGKEITSSSSFYDFKESEDTLTFSFGRSSRYQPTIVILSTVTKNVKFIFQKEAFLSVDVRVYGTKNSTVSLMYQVEENANIKINETVLSTKDVNIDLNRTVEVSENAVFKINQGLFSKGTLNYKDVLNLNGKNATIDFSTLSLGNQKDEYTVTQDIIHKAKFSISTIDNMIVSNESAKISYWVNGTIQKGNNGSNCYQQNKGVILDTTGWVRVDPKLYIDEYDVEAGHGAAIGQIDEDELFYLLSRGLTELDAKRLILTGYTEKYLSNINDGLFKNTIERTISKKIGGN